ncbi:MAG: energy-coupling factor transporter ATPase [Clostridium sp.]|nr:energy-coupling factor transporter ATPase [Clostridium sp.]
MSIEVRNLTHIYKDGSLEEKVAVDNVSFSIKNGEFVAIIGHTGSGKSTLIQHLNGLEKATSGSIIINGIDITKPKVNLIDIRKQVGIVFQYPEYQLFEESVEKDISYGPKNLNLPEEEVNNRVREAMKMVGLDYEKYKDKSPFELSGGQKRRVAIAGVLAMNPNILILDEPTAGLDPKGRDFILDKIKNLHKNYNMTIIIVSHSMEDVANIAERVIVMNDGTIAIDDKVSNVFKRVEELEAMGLAVPQVTYLMRELKKKGFDVLDEVYTVEQAKSEILRVLGR